MYGLLRTSATQCLVTLQPRLVYGCKKASEASTIPQRMCATYLEDTLLHTVDTNLTLPCQWSARMQLLEPAACVQLNAATPLLDELLHIRWDVATCLQHGGNLALADAPHAATLLLTPLPNLPGSL